MRINATIKPNSTKGPLVEARDDGSLLVYIREIAADSKANEALIKLLSTYFNVPKTHIAIVRGLTGRHKIIDVTPKLT